MAFITREWAFSCPLFLLYWRNAEKKKQYGLCKFFGHKAPERGTPLYSWKKWFSFQTKSLFNFS